MYIDDNYLTSDFEDAHIHLKNMLKDTLINIDNQFDSNHEPSYFEILDTYKAIYDFCDLYEIDTTTLIINGTNSINNIYAALSDFYSSFLFNSNNMHENIFANKLYTFTDEEHDDIQSKINELRDKLVNSRLIDDEHKERVLKKLEQLQKELHKKMATLDKFLGGMFSIAHTLGLSAKEAKPFTDDVKDILDITLKTKSRGENLSENKQISTEEILQVTE